MAKFLWLVNPSLWPAAIASWWSKTGKNLIKKYWKVLLLVVLVIVFILKIIDLLVPDEVVSPVKPPYTEQQKTEALDKHSSAKKDLDDKINNTTQDSAKHRERIDRVVNTPSKTVDEAIENWNNNR